MHHVIPYDVTMAMPIRMPHNFQLLLPITRKRTAAPHIEYTSQKRHTTLGACGLGNVRERVSGLQLLLMLQLLQCDRQSNDVYRAAHVSNKFVSR